jgi:hypothetical protein
MTFQTFAVACFVVAIGGSALVFLHDILAERRGKR